MLVTGIFTCPNNINKMDSSFMFVDQSELSAI